MNYLIYNEYTNQHNKMLELRNQYLETLMVKTTPQSVYTIGDFVEVEIINKKTTIVSKVQRPTNHLDYYNPGNYTAYQLKQLLAQKIELIKNEKYRLILSELCESNEEFYLFPAGKSMHHAHIGGLVEHILSMLELADKFIEHYQLDQDLLYTGIILHDFGKLRELKQYGLTYTVEGNVLGHISIATEQIASIAINMGWNEDNDIIALKHLILSHHGRMDYGSPKEPMILEAYVLSMIDEMDAKINLLTNVLEKTPVNKISGPINGFDRRRFWNYKGEK